MRRLGAVRAARSEAALQLFDEVVAQLAFPDEAPEQDFDRRSEGHRQQGADEAAEHQRPEQHRENHRERV